LKEGVKSNPPSGGIFYKLKLIIETCFKDLLHHFSQTIHLAAELCDFFTAD
jgi:hypothetical protein